MKGWFINFHTSRCGTAIPQNDQMAKDYAGSMVSEMALKFLAAGYDLTVYDIKPERLSPIISAGATEARSAANLAKKADLVMTSLRDSAVWVSVTKTELLPHAKSGQTFIDFGTTIVHQT